VAPSSISPRCLRERLYGVSTGEPRRPRRRSPGPVRYRRERADVPEADGSPTHHPNGDPRTDRGRRPDRAASATFGGEPRRHAVNYPDLLPRRFASRSLRSGLPGSASERAGTVPTAVPDSTGGVPRWVGRSVPLLPGRHSGASAVARFVSSFERAKLSRDDETASPFRTTFEQRRRRGEHRPGLFDRRGSTAMPSSGSEPDDGRCLPSLLPPGALAEEGGVAPCTAEAKRAGTPPPTRWSPGRFVCRRLAVTRAAGQFRYRHRVNCAAHARDVGVRPLGRHQFAAVTPNPDCVPAHYRHRRSRLECVSVMIASVDGNAGRASAGWGERFWPRLRLPDEGARAVSIG